ncbi:hypothetical protein ACIRYZ_31185 [Kitasatospora sp. NPDC101155]
MSPISRRRLLRAAGAGALVLPLPGRAANVAPTGLDQRRAPLRSGAPML